MQYVTAPSRCATGLVRFRPVSALQSRYDNAPVVSARAGRGAPLWVDTVEVLGGIDTVHADPAFRRARLLITVDSVPAGQVTVELTGGRATASAIRSAISHQLGSRLTDAAPPPQPVARPITVVIPTRNRPDSLGRCVRSLLRSDHPHLTVLVVDNEPVDDRTEAAVAQLADARVQYVRESRRGTSIGRNRGLLEVVARRGGLVAFTDDDVEVDPAWAGRMAAALSVPGVACVCGPVFAARLDTPAQVTADDALGWRKGYTRRHFSVNTPPRDSALFPFSPGLFGVGANMGVDAAVALELGGFDPALGPGTPSRGGEDCEFMVRLVLAGHTLTYEPSAYVWHHHRSSTTELADQLAGYALGLGAFLAKIMLDPVGRSVALPRIPAALVQLWRIRHREVQSGVARSAASRKLRSVVSGQLAYLRARRAVRDNGGEVPALVAGRCGRPGRR